MGGTERQVPFNIISWAIEEAALQGTPEYQPCSPLRDICCVQGLSAEEQAVLVQCIALKMLTDFTLMYTSAVGLVLRRDADAATRGGSPRSKTPRKDAPRQTGVLLR